MEIRGFVTNAEAYDNGRLIGEWVEFPCEAETVLSTWAEILVLTDIL